MGACGARPHFLAALYSVKEKIEMSTPRPHGSADKTTASKALDAALEESFPASDPIASSPRQGGKDDRRADVAAVPPSTEPETTDKKTPSNMRDFHKTFERRRR